MRHVAAVSAMCSLQSGFRSFESNCQLPTCHQFNPLSSFIQMLLGCSICAASHLRKCAPDDKQRDDSCLQSIGAVQKIHWLPRSWKRVRPDNFAKNMPKKHAAKWLYSAPFRACDLGPVLSFASLVVDACKHCTECNAFCRMHFCWANERK